MTLKVWGHARVSSALEVYRLLVSPTGEHALWRELVSLEPPFWGVLMDHAGPVADLITRGYRVWSWDDHGVVLSARAHEPPHGVHYRTWDFLFHEEGDEPTHPVARLARTNRHAP